MIVYVDNDLNLRSVLTSRYNSGLLALGTTTTTTTTTT